MTEAVSMRWREIEPILDRALDLAAAERPTFLQLNCGDDVELRAEIESLIAADEAAEGLFTTGQSIGAHAEPSAHGTRIGPYRLLEPIGEGGMGRVFLAERVDGDFEQQVAIKLLSLSIDPKARQRFQAECQNLARLDHPNIVHLLDGGTTDSGASYLALQYVQGEPIDRYAKSNALDLHRRVELMVQLCDAVQYAHRNLIVHRDLKPSNVLVTATGQVKLLDFGISHDLADEGTATSSLLTPRYAAPEQILGQAITTATDVYGLGTILHQLLTGVAPYADADGSIESLAARAKRPEPPRPSSLRAVPAKARRNLRGDLDAMVLKCLQADPADRYDSAAAMRDDMLAWLDGRNVSARRASPVTRLGRLIKRNILATAGIGLLLAIAVGATAFHLKTVSEQRDYADATAQFLSGLLVDVKATERNEADTLVMPITHLYELGLERIGDSAMPLDKKIELIKEFASGLYAAGDAAGALAATELAVDIAAAKAPGSYDHLSALFSRAQTYTNNYRYQAARADYQTLIGAIGKQLDADSVEAALIFNDLAVFERNLGNYLVAEPYAVRAIQTIERAPEQGGIYNHSQLLINHAANLMELDRLDQAQDELSRALEIREGYYDEGHFRRAVVYAFQGRLLDLAGRPADALRWHDRAERSARNNLGDDHYNTLWIRAYRARNQLLRGEYEPARAELQRIADAAARGDSQSAAPHADLARALYHLNRLGAADQSAKTALQLSREHYRADHPAMLPSLLTRAVIAFEQQRLADSKALVAKAVEISSRLPVEHRLSKRSNALAQLIGGQCPSEAVDLGQVLVVERQAWVQARACQ